MTELLIRDLSDKIGSEIIGLDPAAALTDPALAERLQTLFDTRGVLVFRDLDIDQRTQANLIRLLIRMPPLGENEPASAKVDDEPFYVSNKEANGGAPFGRLLFHSDMMWSDHTFQVLSLYAVEVEEPVTPTIFISSVDGWATLPDQLRAELEGRTAVQGHSEHEAARAEGDPNVLVSTFENLATRTTPVPMRHPRTGAPLLYVSEQMTSEITELSHDESEELLRKAFDHLYRPEVTYTHVWRTHDLVAWDNIALQHARPNVSLEGPVRTLRKLFAPIPPRTANPARPVFSTRG